MTKENLVKREAGKNKKYKLYTRILWAVALLSMLGVIVFFMLLSKSDLPDFKELENPEFELATTIYDNKIREFGRFYTHNRVPVKFEELNPHLINALIATEDERFYTHTGIDFKALGRVAFGVLTMNGSKGGGSTITQQLAKLLYDRPNFKGLNKLQRMSKLGLTKFKEWITAVKIERSYTKEEIIAMYLNKFEFNHGAYGIRAASEIYFGKQQEDLGVEEAATLVGMLQNPSYYNPVRWPDKVIGRRKVVMNQMKRGGLLSETKYDSLKVLPMDMSNFKRVSHAEGLAPHFRAELAKWLRNLFEQEEYRKADGSKYNIYRDGLKIYTTIDATMQGIAEEQMLKHMANVQDTYFRVWKRKDPWTFEADEFQKGIRTNGLKSLMRFSDRYKGMRENAMADILSRIESSTGIALTDWDIENLIAEDKKKGGIARLVSKKTISASRAKNYRAVMESDLWNELKATKKTFESEVEKVFDTEVQMKVFAYNEKFEKDTVMTPMDSLKYHRQFLQAGSLSVDPRTGEIKTWIGGINHKYFQYDHVETSRQVGSTFKPFVYATAITLQGISPCFPVLDQAYTIAPGDGSFGLLEPWTPQNSDGEYSGETFTLYEGLRKSKNTVSVFLMQQLGNANVVRGLVDLMGIDSSRMRSDGQFRVPNVPSICLGSADLSVMEMTGAYTTFANNGVSVKPYFINKIEDENGRVLYASMSEERIALPEKANYVMVDMLKYAGTGFVGYESEIGGKTGTTNDYVDGWFMGVTPSLVVGTWVGGEDPWIRFLNLQNGQGARMAKPFFKAFLAELEKRDDVDYDSSARFKKPFGGPDIVIDCELYEGMEDDPETEEFKNTEIFEDEFINGFNDQ